MTAPVWLLAVAGSVAGTAAGAADLPAGEALVNAGLAAYNDHDPAKAERIWAAGAAAGNAGAAFQLGLAYDLGQGVAADPARAFRYYWAAAGAGVAAAEFNVAVMFDSGRGTPADAAQAALWYGRAAANGHARAQYDLAQLYAAGDGVPQNYAQAASWYRAAAANGIAAAVAHPRPTMRPAAGAAPAGVLPAPVAIIPAAGTQPARAELVWLCPPQPAPAQYVVSVSRVDAGGLHEVFAAATDVSAIAVDLPAGAAEYAWRVYSVASGAPHYTPSRWERFRVEPPRAGAEGGVETGRMPRG